MPSKRRDLSDPVEKQADLEERLREKGLDPEGRPLPRPQGTQESQRPPPPD